MIRKKISEQESFEIWQNNYCKEHITRGHFNHCYAWLDNGVCPQLLVSGTCCYEHTYPTTWTEKMIDQHKLIRHYMDNLYQGCDILELVGRGKKSAPLITSRSTASLLAVAIEKKVDTFENDLKKSKSMSDFRTCIEIPPPRALGEIISIQSLH